MPGYLAVGLVVGALLSAFAGLHALDRWVHLLPELRRKILHIGMGLVSVAFPWIFDGPGWVLLTCSLVVAVLLLMRLQPGLRAGVGASLHGVARSSFGEIYFAVAVTALFWLAWQDPVLYVVPILVLALGDATAALVGVVYGRAKYTTQEGFKSWEGSTAFFVVTFLAIHVPLLLMTDIGRAETLLIAALIALLLTLLEGAAWGGLDNLVVPFATYLLLLVFRDATAAELVVQLGVFAGLALLATGLGRRVHLKTDGIMAAVLGGFFYWSFGGAAWLAPGLALFILHPFLAQRRGGTPVPADARAVLTIFATSLPWMWAEHVQVAGSYYAFAVGFAAHLAIVLVWTRVEGRTHTGVAPRWLAMAGAAAWALTALPVLLVQGVDAGTLALAAAALPLPMLAAGLFLHWGRLEARGGRLASQATAALGASLVALLVIQFGRGLG